MAKKLEQAHVGIKATELKRVVGDINRNKEKSTEFGGLAGQLTKQACDQHSLDKTALTLTARMNRMEPAKRQAIMRGCLEYWEKMGFFDQVDAFDDIVPTLETIAENARAREGEAGETDSTVTNILEGATAH